MHGEQPYRRVAAAVGWPDVAKGHTRTLLYLQPKKESTCLLWVMRAARDSEFSSPLLSVCSPADRGTFSAILSFVAIETCW